MMICIAFWLLGTVLLSTVPAQAQQPKKVPRIGFLSATSPSAIAARVEAFRLGLRELGYVEEKNIVLEWEENEYKQNFPFFSLSLAPAIENPKAAPQTKFQNWKIPPNVLARADRVIR